MNHSVVHCTLQQAPKQSVRKEISVEEPIETSPVISSDDQPIELCHWITLKEIAPKNE